MMTLHDLSAISHVPMYTLARDPRLRVVSPAGVPLVSSAAVDAWLDALPQSAPKEVSAWTRQNAEGLAKAQAVRREQTARARAVAIEVVLALLPTDPNEPPRNARWLGAELKRRVGAGRRVRDAALADLALQGVIVRVPGGWRRTATGAER